jgi:hypothetical protein
MKKAFLVSTLALIASITSATTVSGAWDGVIPSDRPMAVLCAPSGISGTLNDASSTITCDVNDTQVYFGILFDTNNPQNLQLIGHTTPGSGRNYLLSKFTLNPDVAVVVNNIQSNNIQLEFAINARSAGGSSITVN